MPGLRYGARRRFEGGHLEASIFALVIRRYVSTMQEVRSRRRGTREANRENNAKGKWMHLPRVLQDMPKHDFTLAKRSIDIRENLKHVALPFATQTGGNSTVTPRVQRLMEASRRDPSPRHRTLSRSHSSQISISAILPYVQGLPPYTGTRPYDE